MVPNKCVHMCVCFQVFHDVAYKAKDRNDLLSGIDEFLDQVTVLPPGEWDPSIRIEPPKSVPSQVRTLEVLAAFKICNSILGHRLHILFCKIKNSTPR